MRFVDTNLTEQAFITNQNNGQISFTPTTARKETTDLMPSFNLRATLADGLLFRFSASKTVTRPSFSQLNPAQSFSGAGQTLLGTSSSGNPNLNAEKSVNLDVGRRILLGTRQPCQHGPVPPATVKGYIQTAVYLGPDRLRQRPADRQTGAGPTITAWRAFPDASIQEVWSGLFPDSSISLPGFPPLSGCGLGRQKRLFGERRVDKKRAPKLPSTGKPKTSKP